MARELLECYYWTRTFKFAHHELCLLKPFLETDGFGLGMIPAHYARRFSKESAQFMLKIESVVEILRESGLRIRLATI